MSPFLECVYLSWLTPSVSCRLPEYIFCPVSFALPVQWDRSRNLQLVYESLSSIYIRTLQLDDFILAT